MDQSFGIEGGYAVSDEALRRAENFPGRTQERPQPSVPNPYPTPDFDVLPEDLD